MMHIGSAICGMSGLDPRVWLGMWAMPADLHTLIIRPWTILVYMFAQYDVLHLLFNMLWLYGFARIFLILSNGRQLVAIYIYSGIAGAVCFISGSYLYVNNDFATASLIGSSASVMGIIAGAATLYPDMPLRMFLLGDIKLKWIAVATLVLFVLTASNSHGSMFAHIGGAAMGSLYGLQTRRGRDMTRGFNTFIHSVRAIFSPAKKTGARHSTSNPHFSPFRKNDKTKYSSTASQNAPFTSADQAELDAILKKVKQSGYTGLTAEEKRRLFEVSRRIK